MKILFTTSSLTNGGAERVCSVVASELARMGHEVSLLTTTSRPVTYRPDSYVKLVTVTIGRGLWAKLTWRFRLLLFLIRLFKQERPDVVVCTLGFLAWQAKLASMLTCHCPVIFSDHNAYERPKGVSFSWHDRWYKFHLPRILDGVTVLAQRDKEILNGRFKNIAVMPNPMFLTPAVEVGPKENIILAVGRLDAWYVKGFDLLLGAWSQIEQAHPDWCLRLVGNASEQTIVKLRSFAGNAKRVEFATFTPNIIEEYRRASIFVLSSRYEGFGMVLTEAMSQGCAAIACDYMGRQADIIGFNGLLIPVSNDQEDRSIEHALAIYLSVLMDDNLLRRKLQQMSLHAVDKYAPQRIAKRWDEYLCAIAKAK